MSTKLYCSRCSKNFYVQGPKGSCLTTDDDGNVVLLLPNNKTIPVSSSDMKCPNCHPDKGK